MSASPSSVVATRVALDPQWAAVRAELSWFDTLCAGCRWLAIADL